MREMEIALSALRMIAETSGHGPAGNVDEWTEADAFTRCREIAREALQEIEK